MRQLAKTCFNIWLVTALVACGILPGADQDDTGSTTETGGATPPDQSGVDGAVVGEYADCTWMILESYPEQIKGTCTWKKACAAGGTADVKLAEGFAPAAGTLKVMKADDANTALAHTLEGDAVRLQASACPSAGTKFRIDYTADRTLNE